MIQISPDSDLFTPYYFPGFAVDDPRPTTYREFDASLGDERKFTIEEAIDRAQELAVATGIRRVVRTRDGRSKSTPDDHIVPPFLIQAV